MWKDIVGFEGIYAVDESGQVISFKRNKSKGQLLKPTLSTTGYETVKLYDGHSKYKRYSVHRLVAEAFIPNIHEKPEVNHKDEIKTNNHVSNLEWVTPKENCNHGTRIERVTQAINYESVGEKNSKPILQLDEDNNIIREWNSIKECMLKTGFDNSNIVKCCRNKMKTAYGYKWCYA